MADQKSKRLELIAEIDLVEDTYLMRGIARTSLFALTIFLIAAPFLALAFYAIALPYGEERLIDFPLIFVSLVVVLLSIPFHELIHGAAFKLMNPKARVRFGYAEVGIVFASATGVFFSRKHYLIICMMPFMVLSLIYLAIGLIFKAPLTAYICFAMHTAGCVGDFYYVKRILENPRIKFCQDTKSGVRFYGYQGQ